MKARQQGSLILVCVVAVLALVLVASPAYPWGAATHAYIDDHVGKQWPVRNLNEMYGGNAPDAFNYMFDHREWLDYLFQQTHYSPLSVWQEAERILGKAAAFGFVSHNEAWGADYSAHISCRTCGPLPEPKGYVIVKAEAMWEILGDLGFGKDTAIELYHNIVESALDLLVKSQLDPGIGPKLSAAALLRSAELPTLLVDAYASGFEQTFQLEAGKGAEIITSAEAEFRKTTVLYGQVLAQDDRTAARLVAEQLVGMAEGFLGYPLPPDYDWVALTQVLLSYASYLCKDDFSGEINATVQTVDEALRAHGIAY